MMNILQSALVAVSILSGVASAWTGAAVALLYIDARMRTEHLDHTLRIAAANTPAPKPEGLNPPIPPGF